jgi:class 3 adenylate cyclase/DNA-binding beta-propeller fold protein YncE
VQRVRRESALATVLFTDIVRSTDIASEMGDRRWRVLVSRHHEIVRRELKRYGGREIDTAGDGFFATFTSQANAIRCAAAIVAAVQVLGIDVRAGLHVGEAEYVGRKLGGMAVHIGARVLSNAGPAEVLITSILRELVPGAGFEFEDRGTHSLKGVPGQWHLYRVTSVGQPPVRPLDAEVAAERRAAIEPPPMWRRRYVPMATAAAVLLAVVVAIVTIAGGAGGRPAPGPTHRASAPLAHALFELDPQTGRILAQVPIGHPATRDGPGSPGPAPHGVATGQSSVWVTNQRDDSVTRVDAASHAVTAIHATSPNAVAIGADAVWVADDTGGVTSIDPLTNAATRVDLPTGLVEPLDVGVDPTTGAVVTASMGCITCPLGVVNFAKLAFLDASGGSDGVVVLGSNPVTHAVALLGDAAWVEAGTDLWRVDLRSHHVTARLSLGEGLLWTVAPDPDHGALWISISSLGGAAASIVRVDASTRKVVQTLPVGCCPGALAVGEGAVWVTNSRDGTVTRIDPATGATKVFHVAAGADGIAVGYGHVWVTVDRPGVLG